MTTSAGTESCGSACPFCQPAPERIIFENPLVIALWDAFPVNRGHALIVPRRHTHCSVRMVECLKSIVEVAMKFQVVLEPAEEGGFTVTVPALDGCFTEGDTVEESLENAKEAIHCYLEGLEKLNEIKARPESTVREVEVAI